MKIGKIYLAIKSGRITTHYSSAELSNLIEAVNKVCKGQSVPVLALLKTPDLKHSRKSHTIGIDKNLREAENP